MNWDVIVIGGGAAGMMAALTAAERGKRVLLLERNDKLGKKIFISGKGRCNLTNADEDRDVFIKNTIRNGKFMYSAFSQFTNYDLMKYFEDAGVPLKIERGKRVFPVSDKSSDIIKALKKMMKKAGVKIRPLSRVKEIRFSDNKVTGVKVYNGDIIHAERIILATGGASYPGTGSTGDGFHLARKLGHNVVNPEPSLVPIKVEEAWVEQLQGLSLRNVRATLVVNGKKKESEFGEMMFAHYGLTGPIILTLSAFTKKYLKKKVEISLDLKPALDEQMLDKRLQKDFAKFSRKQFGNSLGELLPKALIPVVINLSGITKEKKVCEVTKQERRNLAGIFKDIRFSVTGLMPLEIAIITAGGVSTKEINPSTMESKIIEGLYFAGEIINVDALTGGFNFQIAFSSGHLAGMNV